jgi:hypothetical protein
MADDIQIAQSISIREAGYDEFWLQDQIWSNPASLNLGELDALDKERRQNSGGRLDLLLKDPQDDTMYEVEVMLGETDETHIIRTIEYWDNEKRRWPQRQHYAVLIAEHITRRFFNVIHILSHSVPIIAIQVSLIESNGKRSLFFTKVLDTYEEVDDGGATVEIVNREVWVKKAKWTVDAVDKLLNIVAPSLKEPVLSYVKNYVAINVGRNNYFWLHKRSGNKSLLGFRMAAHLAEDAQQVLDAAGIPFAKKPKQIFVTVDSSMIEAHKDAFEKIAELVRRTWDKES